MASSAAPVDLDEAKRIIRAAQDRDVVLRVFGGLAIQMHCKDIQFCTRKHVDLDVVGLSRQSAQIVSIFEGMGYVQNQTIALSVGGERMLFEKPESKDHIDVLLDRLTFEHTIDLRGRLEIEEFTISVSDLLLSKLSIARLNEKDFRDIITLLKERPFASQDLRGTVNIGYIVGLCSKRWGLCHDVLRALDACTAMLGTYELDPVSREHALQNLNALKTSISAAKKTIHWKLRGTIGEHMPWRRAVDETGTWTSMENTASGHG